MDLFYDSRHLILGVEAQGCLTLHHSLKHGPRTRPTINETGVHGFRGFESTREEAKGVDACCHSRWAMSFQLSSYPTWGERFGGAVRKSHILVNCIHFLWYERQYSPCLPKTYEP
jgi:hypothetical protein